MYLIGEGVLGFSLSWEVFYTGHIPRRLYFNHFYFVNFWLDLHLFTSLHTQDLLDMQGCNVSSDARSWLRAAGIRALH